MSIVESGAQCRPLSAGCVRAQAFGGGRGGEQQQLHVSDPQNAAKEQNIEVGRCGSLLAFRLVLSAAALPLHMELSKNRNIVTKNGDGNTQISTKL